MKKIIMLLVVFIAVALYANWGAWGSAAKRLLEDAIIGNGNGTVTIKDNAYFEKSVGIGTNSPDEPFHVAGNGTQLIKIENTSGPNVTIGAYTASSAMVSSEGLNLRASSGALGLQIGNVNRIYIKSDGKVGIGYNLTNPTAMLDVDGTFRLRQNSLPSSPSAGFIALLQANDADPDTIAVYNGTSWKYFISQ